MSELDLLRRIEELEKQNEEYKRVIETISMLEKSDRITKYLNDWKINSKVLSLINTVNDEKLDFFGVQEENIIRYKQEKRILEEQISQRIRETLPTHNSVTTGEEVFLIKEHELYIEIIGYSGFESDLIVTPQTINGKPVEVIGNNAFQNSRCKRIIISEPVTIIGKNAFQKAECESIVLPNTLKEIQDEAFWGCEHLADIVMSKNVISIGKSAFERCIGLKVIDLPETLTELGNECFWQSGLEKVVLPGSIKKIPQSCFQNCRDLTSIILKNGIYEIEHDAFTKTGITDIVFPESVKKVNNKLMDSSYLARNNTINLVFLGKDTVLIRTTLHTSHIIIYCVIGSKVLSDALRWGYEVHPLADYNKN